MEESKLRVLVENDLYSLVLAYSDDDLFKASYSTVGKAINQFVKTYKDQLTIENIDFLTEYIWTVINKRQNYSKKENENEK